MNVKEMSFWCDFLFLVRYLIELWRGRILYRGKILSTPNNMQEYKGEIPEKVLS